MASTSGHSLSLIPHAAFVCMESHPSLPFLLLDPSLSSLCMPYQCKIRHGGLSAMPLIAPSERLRRRSLGNSGFLSEVRAQETVKRIMAGWTL